jgi:3-hydroxyisobutyrate dehydrogenase-like beta-hydroxyacid dehydrogenase
MRVLSFLVVGAVAASIAAPARAQEDFMKECMVTSSQKTCDCIYQRLPADKRAAAVAGMKKSNAATQPGGNLLDPSTLTPEQMQGLDAVVQAQAYCM